MHPLHVLQVFDSISTIRPFSRLKRGAGFATETVAWRAKQINSFSPRHYVDRYTYRFVNENASFRFVLVKAISKIKSVFGEVAKLPGVLPVVANDNHKFGLAVKEIRLMLINGQV